MKFKRFVRYQWFNSIDAHTMLRFRSRMVNIEWEVLPRQVFLCDIDFIRDTMRRYERITTAELRDVS